MELIKTSQKNRVPNAVVLLLSLIIIVGLVSFLIPSGQYDFTMVDGRKIIDPESFHYVEKMPIGIVDFFSTIHQGLTAGAPLIFMILTIGGSVKVFESTGAITGVVAEFARRFGQSRTSWVLVLIFTFFALLGGFPGMLETAIPFAPLCLAIALALGYDAIVGIAVPVIAISIGWTAGPTNPWTVGIGQNLSGLPLFSGMGYRLLILLALWAISLFWILRYASKVKQNRSNSLVEGLEGVISESNVDLSVCPFTKKHQLILVIFMAVIAIIVYGSVFWKWGFSEMSALYIIGAAIAGFVAGYSPNGIADIFVEGGRSMYAGVFAVGLARGISVMMEKAGIIDTVINALSVPLQNLSTSVSAGLMFVIQTLINFFIPSGSGQALATLPIMLPLADIIGVNKQVAILAFQFGDGLSNICYPTVAVLIAYLTYTDVPLSKWLRFVAVYMLMVWGAALMFTVGGVMMNWS